MNDLILNTSTLPEPLPRMIRSDKVRVHETDGVITMTPAKEMDGPLFTPRTKLGNRLSALRTKAILAGMKLLTEEEVLEEVKLRRGELLVTMEKPSKPICRVKEVNVVSIHSDSEPAQ